MKFVSDSGIKLEGKYCGRRYLQTHIALLFRVCKEDGEKTVGTIAWFEDTPPEEIAE